MVGCISVEGFPVHSILSAGMRTGCSLYLLLNRENEPELKVPVACHLLFSLNAVHFQMQTLYDWCAPIGGVYFDLCYYTFLQCVLHICEKCMSTLL